MNIIFLYTVHIYDRERNEDESEFDQQENHLLFRCARLKANIERLSLAVQVKNLFVRAYQIFIFKYEAN